MTREAEINTLKWALETAERLYQGASVLAIRIPAKPDVDTLRYLLFRTLLPPTPDAPTGLLITPEMAHRWVMGEDRQLGERINALAHAYMEQPLRRGPACDLCGDSGRVADDIPCWTCDEGKRLMQSHRNGQER